MRNESKKKTRKEIEEHEKMKFLAKAGIPPHPKLMRSEEEIELSQRHMDEDNVWGNPPSSGLFKSPPSMAFGSKKHPQAYEERSNEQVLPKEKIILYKETTKLYAFCVNGTLKTL